MVASIFAASQFFSGNGGGGPITFNRFVDSVNGNDANDGLTSGTAKQTIAGLGAITSGMKIGLARDSVWYEEIDTAVDGIQIGAYGSGKLPTLDAADTVGANWVKTVGRTNIYEYTFTHTNYVGGYPSLWEDALRMRWINGLAALDAAPGRFYAANTTGTSVTIYVYPTGGGDPNSNGKLYEFAKRLYGIHLDGASTVVQDVHTRRQLHSDGSLIISGSNSRAYRCLAEDGTKHNAFAGVNCEMVDCIAWKCDWADRTPITLFVGYVGVGTGYSVAFRGCVARGVPSISAVSVGGSTIVGFLCHNTSSSTGLWSSITYEDCSVYGVNKGFDGSAVNAFYTRPYIRESWIGAGGSSDTQYITDMNTAETVGATLPMTQSYEHFRGVAYIEGLRDYGRSTTSKGRVYGANTNGTDIHVSKSVFFRPSGMSGAYYAMFGAGTTNRILEDHCIVDCRTTSDTALRLPNGGTADFNVYNPSTIDFRVGAVTYNDFAAYRAAQPSYDPNSVTGDPLFVDPANDDWNLGVGSPAIALGAGLERPNITYTPIPSDAALGAM